MTKHAQRLNKCKKMGPKKMGGTCTHTLLFSMEPGRQLDGNRADKLLNVQPKHSADCRANKKPLTFITTKMFILS